MKVLFAIAISLFGIITISNAQVKYPDLEVFDKFERLTEVNGKTCVLSSNGGYVLFSQVSTNKGLTTILKNRYSGTEKRFKNTSSVRTLNRDRIFSFNIEQDTLVIFDTETGNYKYLPNVKSYFVIKSNLGDRIAYYTKMKNSTSLFVWRAKSGTTKEIKDVDFDISCWANRQGTGLLTKGPRGITYTNLETEAETLLDSNRSVETAAFNDSGTQLAYILKTSGGNELRHVNIKSGTVTILLDESSKFLRASWRLGTTGLSYENGSILFKIESKDNRIGHSGESNSGQIGSIHDVFTKNESIITNDVNVWSYQDVYVQDRQLDALREKESFTCLINVENKFPVQIESKTLRLEPKGRLNRYFVLTTRTNENEFYWNNERPKMYLFSILTGKKEVIKESGFPGFQFIDFSPDNQYLIWFDGVDGNYYSYNIAKKKTTNISGSGDNSFRASSQRAASAGLVVNSFPRNGHFWVADNRSLIVHATNDIWQLDPAGVRKPINLTHGYGATHEIRFNLIETEDRQYSRPVELSPNKFLVSAFNNRTKQNGFWTISLGKSLDPTKLVMADYGFFFHPTAPYVAANSAENPTAFKPVKSLDNTTFVVRRMNSFNLPNLYATRDFKKFEQLSKVNADTQYVRIRSKLVSYVLPDGQKSEGILHLPYELDSTRKYPIIFNYYERRSEGLHIYRTPELSGHNINIPWYLSRGYLVFEPDFYYERGETAQSVINGARTAIIELAKLPYVDTANIGAQGQSFGGYESNVLAIQTNLFKAVCAMAGPTNIISEYGSLRPNGYNNQSSADQGQRNLGVFPWENPDVFIKNSPNFHIGKATTPLLLVHNKKDDAILFSQAIELYLGMRRLNKRVWMLEYDKEGHGIQETNNKLDFTIRMQQFFDHYLKDASAPYWMTRGIPASMKGIDSGLELDTEIKTPSEGIARPVEKGKIF